jgi:hypothetical protein
MTEKRVNGGPARRHEANLLGGELAASKGNLCRDLVHASRISLPVLSQRTHQTRLPQASTPVAFFGRG